MTSISEQQDDWIRLEIHKLTLDQRPLQDVLLDIDGLERRIVEAIGAEEYAADLLNVRRVLARLRLVRAVELNAEATLAKTLFDQAVMLGFFTREDAVVAAALLSRVCLARGRVDLLNSELEEALRQLDDEPHPSYARLVSEIRGGQGVE